MLGASQQVFLKVLQNVWLISCVFVSAALTASSPETGKCAVFDAFKVLPENSTVSLLELMV